MPRARKTRPSKTAAPSQKALDLDPSTAATPGPAGTAATLVDYISGERVRATPEEIDAVQVFARRLVADHGYPKGHIRTHPQHRVRRAPSDRRRTYPVDIAVFRSDQARDDELYIVVECKKRSRRDGLEQLELYLDMSSAEIGVWFNGDDHIYLRKVLTRSGRRYDVLPNIPRHGQEIADIGRFYRSDLRVPSNLKAVFRDLRNHLAGNATGITRDEALAQEIINILFCKIFDELNTGPGEVVEFRAGADESPRAVKKRIQGLFEKVKGEYDEVFRRADTIRLDPDAIRYVVGELQNYAVTEAERDAVGDAFEVFIGPALRGAEGQFFTPRNAVKMAVEILDPRPGETIIDPACGSGGFLVAALSHVWSAIDEIGRDKKWSERQIERKKWSAASKCFRGIDKDAFLAKVTKAYMAIVGDSCASVFCENSLERPEVWRSATRDHVVPGTFDVVLTNPPFGKKIRVGGDDLLAQYQLGHRWTRDPETGRHGQLDRLVKDQVPQLLFLERCVQLLKPGGRLGIVLPESVLGNPSYGHVVEWLLTTVELLGVVTLPEALFKTSGKGGTHAKVCVMFARKPDRKPDRKATGRPRRREPTEPDPVFMAAATWCGHDSRGNPTVRRGPDGAEVLLDDVPIIARNYHRLASNPSPSRSDEDHLGFLLPRSQLERGILVPKYYDPELTRDLAELVDSHALFPIAELEERGILDISTGVEVGKMAYGTGPYPFIRTSDIANWELKSDPKHGVSQAVFDSHKARAQVAPGDILMVRDGTYLIGTCAMVTQYDGDALFQSHLYRLRVTNGSGDGSSDGSGNDSGEESARKPPTLSFDDAKKGEKLDPYLFFAALNAPIVRRQIRAKQFTQDIIDTLGARIRELRIALPRDRAARRDLARRTRKVIETRARLRREAREIAVSVAGHGSADDYSVLL